MAINKPDLIDKRLDVVGLILAGLINTFFAMFVAGVLLAPGTRNGQPDFLSRVEWIVEHQTVWQGGWLFWFVVTLTFAWSYFALGRHFDRTRPWASLAIGLAIIAAAVDLVGVVINIVVLPELAIAFLNGASSLQFVFLSMESLSVALVNIAAFGLYSFAGVLLLPAAFATKTYPRPLAWLGVAEWGIALFATFLLVAMPQLATGPLLISFFLYAPWVWGSGIWLYRQSTVESLKGE